MSRSKPRAFEANVPTRQESKTGNEASVEYKPIPGHASAGPVTFQPSAESGGGAAGLVPSSPSASSVSTASAVSTQPKINELLIRILKGDYDADQVKLTEAFDTVLDATDCSKKLGSGSFGTVYKACLQTNPCESCIVLKLSDVQRDKNGNLKNFDAEFNAMNAIFTALSSFDSQGVTLNIKTLVPRPIKTFRIIEGVESMPVMAMEYARGLELRATLGDLRFTQDLVFQGTLAQLIALLFTLTRLFPEFQHMDLNQGNILLADPMLTRIGVRDLGVLSPRDLGCPSLTLLDFGLATFRHANLGMHDDIYINKVTGKEERAKIQWYFDTETLPAYKSYDFKMIVYNFSMFLTDSLTPLYAKFWTWVFSSVFATSFDATSLASLSPGDKQKAMYSYVRYFYHSPDTITVNVPVGKKLVPQKRSIYIGAELVDAAGKVQDSRGTRVFALVLQAAFGLGGTPTVSSLQGVLDLAIAAGPAASYPMFRRFDWGHIITHPFIKVCFTSEVPKAEAYFPPSEDVTLMEE